MSGYGQKIELFQIIFQQFAMERKSRANPIDRRSLDCGFMRNIANNVLWVPFNLQGVWPLLSLVPVNALTQDFFQHQVSLEHACHD